MWLYMMQQNAVSVHSKTFEFTRVYVTLVLSCVRSVYYNVLLTIWSNDAVMEFCEFVTIHDLLSTKHKN